VRRHELSIVPVVLDLVQPFALPEGNLAALLEGAAR
jgi:hypothetical protein